MRPLLLFLLTWPAPSVAQPAGTPGAEAAADEKALRAAGLRTDDAALLDFFRGRTLSSVQKDQYGGLIKDLSSPRYTKRVQATENLAKSGYLVKPLLVQVTREPADCEAARRAQLCLSKLEHDPDAGLAAAAARLLAGRKPAGTVAVLLAYLPFAADGPVIEEVVAALAVVSVRDGKPNRALVAALRDPLPLTRTAAAEALCRAGRGEFKSDFLAALKVRDPEARLRLALALFERRHREALPALIDLLAELPAHEVWRAEEALRLAAGDRGPDVLAGPDTPAKKVRDAWAAWWAKHGPATDLAKLDLTPRLLGHTLITQMDPRSGSGRVFELGPDRQVKWEFADVRYPVDAQVTGHNRVLVAEYLGRRVSERDFKGKVIWEKRVELPIACQRLPSGHTFIATRRQLLVLDRAGKEVFTYHHQATSISAARKLRDGQTVFVSGGNLVRLDPAGKQVKSFPVGLVYTLGGNIDALANGHVLVPEYNHNKVTEYDPDGRMCWSVAVRFPISAVRLANGHTLVVSMAEQRVVEFDREGHEVWAYALPGRLWRARGR